MRRLGAVVLALALLAQINTAVAQPAPSAPAPAQTHQDWKPLAIGLGAIAGVVVFNAVALGFEALPGGLAVEAGATVPAEMSVAISRVYATTAAVVGGLIAYYTLYPSGH
jgi:hypothetical protein